MNELHLKLAAVMTRGNLNKWLLGMPHFDGNAPHRYTSKISDFIETDSDEKCCTYCGKPESYEWSPANEETKV